MDTFANQVLAFLLVLGPLVMIHEIGHFIFAKRAGIRVQEFGIGFPPRATRLWRGKGALTIGSRRVDIPRNFRLPEGLADGRTARAVAFRDGERLTLKSIAVQDGEATAAPASEALIADETRLVGEVSRLDRGTDYTLNWLPIGGFVKMLGEEDPSAPDSFAAAPKRHRSAVLLAGPGANIVAALALFLAAFMLGQLAPVAGTVTIGEIAAGSPAEQAGLESGMIVVAVDGQPVDYRQTLIAYTQEHLGQSVRLTVRDATGTTRDIEVYARSRDEIPEGQGPIGVIIESEYEVVYHALPQAALLSAQATLETVGGIVSIPRQLLAGEISPEMARPVGPAGIAQIAAYALEASVEQGLPFQLLTLAGSISVALAVTNLLPLPALDGGRLVFVLIEAVRGRRVSPEREAVVHFAGMMFLLALFVLITVQDLSNPIQNIYR